MRITIIIAVIFFSGCFVRTYTVERQRCDLDMEGNRGYLVGAPKSEPVGGNLPKKSRKISVIEFELGRHENPAQLQAREESAVYREDAPWEFADSDSEKKSAEQTRLNYTEPSESDKITPEGYK